jgi:hypothetical protein
VNYKQAYTMLTASGIAPDRALEALEKAETAPAHVLDERGRVMTVSLSRTGFRITITEEAE